MQLPRSSLSPALRRHGPATLALVAAVAGLAASPAQAAYPARALLTSAVVCNAPDANETRPTRSWGVRNYAAKPVVVTCPINRDEGGMPVYGVMVYGNSVAFGDRVDCSLVSLRKQDGMFLTMKLFSVTGHQSGMPGTWVYLEPAARDLNAVMEVRCTLPAAGRAWLTAFETFAD